MAEYIEREAAINIVLMGNIDKDYPRMDIAARLHDIPAADVTPVRHGRWIDMGDFISCSECQVARLKEFESYYGKAMRLDARTNYCPNCGAKMEGE